MSGRSANNAIDGDRHMEGAEAIIVPVLKFIMLGVIVGGGVAVFREMIPMARGRTLAAPAKEEEQA